MKMYSIGLWIILLVLIAFLIISEAGDRTYFQYQIGKEIRRETELRRRLEQLELHVAVLTQPKRLSNLQTSLVPLEAPKASVNNDSIRRR